jgi:hypothetical protein
MEKKKYNGTRASSRASRIMEFMFYKEFEREMIEMGRKKEILNAFTGKGESVLDALGIKYKKKGSYVFFLCLNPKHDDIHATNCFLTQTGCVCKACGKRMSFLEIVQTVTGKNYPQAIQFLTDLIKEGD